MKCPVCDRAAFCDGDELVMRCLCGWQATFKSLAVGVPSPLPEPVDELTALASIIRGTPEAKRILHNWATANVHQ